MRSDRTFNRDLPGMPVPESANRPFQFSLRTLLIVVTLCALPCSWLAIKLRKAERRLQVIAEIQADGARVLFDNGEFPSILEVDAGPTAGYVTDEVLESLGGEKKLRTLLIPGATITAAGFEHLKEMTRLESLNLSNTAVTDADLKNLKGLARLRFLDLSNTAVTDAGLDNIKQLPSLRDVSVAGTEVTHSGAATLPRLPRNVQFQRLLKDWGVNIPEEP